MTDLLSTYGDASDEDVLRNYEAGCALEVAAYEAGRPVPAIVKSTLDAWMSEGIRRGIL